MTNNLFDFTEEEFDNDFKGKTLAVSLHNHSDQSLDGGSTVEGMMDRAIELSYSHFTLSEHGNINSAATMHDYAEKLKKKGKNLKIFHSVEGYIKFPEDEKDCHITIGFKTKEAYEKYCKLTKDIYSPEQLVVKWGDAKPVMTVEQFQELASTGIVVGTGCIGSWLNRLIVANKLDLAKKRLDWMVSLVGKDNIYDEFIVDQLSHQYVRAQYDENKRLIKPAFLKLNECHPHFLTPDIGKGCNYTRREYITGPFKIKPVASLDSHYSRKRDKNVQESRMDGRDWVMSTFQHMKGAAEFARDAKLHDHSEKFIEELIDNTHEYCEQFKDYSFRTAKDGWILPNYTGNKSWVYEEAKKIGKVDFNNKEYKERFDYEVSVFADNGVSDFLNYIRIVREIVTLAEENGVLVNVRGSAGGSLVYYALGISVIDPVKYDLQFERHLTLGRIKAGTIPDCDLDFSNKSKMLDILSEKYGDGVVPISIDSLLKPKSAIKDAERFMLGYVRPETEEMTKNMPTIPQGVDELEWLFGKESDEDGLSIKGYFDTDPVLQKYAKNNPDIWQTVTTMCGVQRQKSTHACGMITLHSPVQNFMPLYNVGGKGGTLATGFNPKGVEYVGGVKLDILGVKTMYTIEKCIQMLNEKGYNYHWGEFPHDEQVYKNIYHTGKLSATFQTHTKGIADLCIKAKPMSIEDLSVIIALYRPSCLNAQVDWDSSFTGNIVDYYLGYRSGRINPKFVHEDMIPIIGNTAGAFIFQEQLLKTFRDIGGMSYEEAEQARRAIGKKDKEVLVREANKLIAKCLERGWSETQAKSLFNNVVASGEYGFNKAHSTSYAIVSYATAYLKYHHPLEFWCAELTVNAEDQDKLREYAYELGDLILPPDVFKSAGDQFIIENGKLRTPLSSVRGVGVGTAIAISKLFQKLL